MRLLVVVSVLLLIKTAAGFRGNSNRGSSSISSSQSNQLNIGLIAPHTNFGEFNGVEFYHLSVHTLCNNLSPNSGNFNYVTIKYSFCGLLIPHPSRHLIKTFAFPSNDFPVFIFFLSIFVVVVVVVVAQASENICVR